MMKIYFNWLGINNEGVRRIIQLTVGLLWIVNTFFLLKNLNWHYITKSFISMLEVAVYIALFYFGPIIAFTIVVKISKWIMDGFKK